MESKDEPIIPWRETHQHTITPSVFNYSEDKTSRDYRVDQEDVVNQWNSLIEYLNLVQGEIKSVTVYERGRSEYDKEYKYESNSHRSTNYGYGYGWGWGLTMVDFIVVIYEEISYIPYSTYQQRMQECRNKLGQQKNQQKLKTLRSELSSARSTKAELESEVSDLRERYDAIVKDKPEEKGGWAGKSWVFDGIKYKSKEQADQAYNEALEQVKSELSTKESRLNSAAKSVDSLRSQVEILESGLQASE